MSKVDDLIALKDRIEKVKSEMERSEGKLETAIETAKKEFGTADVKKLQVIMEAKIKIRKELSKKIEVTQEKLEALLEEIEDE